MRIDHNTPQAELAAKFLRRFGARESIAATSWKTSVDIDDNIARGEREATRTDLRFSMAKGESHRRLRALSTDQV